MRPNAPHRRRANPGPARPQIDRTAQALLNPARLLYRKRLMMDEVWCENLKQKGRGGQALIAKRNKSHKDPGSRRWIQEVASDQQGGGYSFR